MRAETWPHGRTINGHRENSVGVFVLQQSERLSAALVSHMRHQPAKPTETFQSGQGRNLVPAGKAVCGASDSIVETRSSRLPMRQMKARPRESFANGSNTRKALGFTSETLNLFLTTF